VAECWLKRRPGKEKTRRSRPTTGLNFQNPPALRRDVAGGNSLLNDVKSLLPVISPSS
jgi:hypothetical protein